MAEMEAAKNRPPIREKRTSRWLVGQATTPDGKNHLSGILVVRADTASKAAESYGVGESYGGMLVVYPLRPDGGPVLFSQTMMPVMVPYESADEDESV